MSDRIMVGNLESVGCKEFTRNAFKLARMVMEIDVAVQWRIFISLGGHLESFTRTLGTFPLVDAQVRGVEMFDKLGTVIRSKH